MRNDIDLVGYCWRDRCRFEQDWYPAGKRLRRLWYTFKASVCILLHRIKEGYSCRQNGWDDVLVDVTMWDFQRERGGIGDAYPSYAATWNQLSVVRGSWHVHVFRNANY